MKVIVLSIIWSALAVYSLLCLWMPEIRPYYRPLGRRRFGLFASLALAIFFWFPLIFLVGSAAGLFGEEAWPTAWVVFSFCMLAAIVGSWIEYFSD